MIAVRCSSLLATILVLALSTAAAASDEALARAKDLYRSAAYDEALAALDRVAAESEDAIKVEANEYRLFCLIALDRKADARVVIESMVNADPFYQLSTDQASPRVRAMFKDIRQSLLPTLVQREYNTAKTAFDKQDGDATEQFDRVLKLLEDPLITQTPALTDLRMVASGFRDLSRARAPKVEFAGATAPVVAQTQAAPVAPAPAQANAATAAPASPARSGPPIYREGDAEVVAPVTINQDLPQWVMPQGTRPGAWQPEAIVEVTISESGDVVNVVLRKQFHPSYDQQLLKAAMNWKYEPARRAGVPVRYVKLVAVRLGGQN
jgi:TonB family protein